jgi:hypothetical protein
MANRGIFTKGSAKFYMPHAGEKYRPSNGFEGELFKEAYCYHCALYGDPCDEDCPPCMIELNAMFHDVDHPKYPKEWQIGKDGQPRCTAFREIDTPEGPIDDPDQLQLL